VRRALPMLLPLAGLAAACAPVGPNFAAPAPPSPEAGYAPVPAGSSAASAPQAAVGAPLSARWWDSFGSREISGLVDRALAGNRTLAASTATLERARERIRAVAGEALPQVDASAQVSHQKRNLAAFGFDPARFGTTGGNPEFDLYSVGGGISFDPDLFGGKRRAAEQARAEADAAAQELAAARITIAGRVVIQAMTIASLNDRIAAEQGVLDEDRQTLTFTEKRQRAGVGTMVEVLSAQGQLAADQADLPQLQQQLAEARSMLISSP